MGSYTKGWFTREQKSVVAMDPSPVRELSLDPEGLSLEVPMQIQVSRKRKGIKMPSLEARKVKAASLAIRKPSHCLKTGIGSFSQGDGSLRSQNRHRLLRLLQKYMERHMWEEACAILSVLLQATVRDASPSLNRIKFKAIFQLLFRTNRTSFQEIWKIYDLWCTKLSSFDTKGRRLVQSESIIHCLQLGEIKGAREAALGLIQERGFESDPYANWVVSLVFCRLLYSGIPDELQLREMGSSFVHTLSEAPPDFIFAPNSVSDQGTASFRSKNDSGTSIAFHKKYEDSDNEEKNEQMFRDSDLREETTQMNLEPFNMKSYEKHSQSSDHEVRPPHASIFCTQGLPLWLLPMELPSSDGDLEAARYAHGKLNTDYYRSALKHLRATVELKPEKIDAFLPLIQMLLMGDQVDEALDEVEKICNSTASECHLRIKAHVLEHFDGGKHFKLRECYESILMKKPSCSYCLERLINMHQQGIYDTTNLVKMIALHLDASPGAANAWQCLASCLLKLSDCEVDRASTCYDATDSYNKIPELFTIPASRRVWKVRARWWLDRHFHPKNLQKDISSDDLKMLTHKAAVASYIYGPRFSYVVSAVQRLEEKDEMELYSSLQMHILNSVGFYSVV